MIKQIYNARYAYKRSLREIVGVTFMGLTFSATFTFLSSARKNNFTWALERHRGLFLTYEDDLQVIVSEQDLALMNAIANVFLKHILCRFHILKIFKVKYKMLVYSVEAWMW